MKRPATVIVQLPVFAMLNRLKFKGENHQQSNDTRIGGKQVI